MHVRVWLQLHRELTCRPDRVATARALAAALGANCNAARCRTAGTEKLERRTGAAAAVWVGRRGRHMLSHCTLSLSTLQPPCMLTSDPDLVPGKENICMYVKFCTDTVTISRNLGDFLRNSRQAPRFRGPPDS